MRIAWVYITTNLVNGKKYIGQTVTPKSRGYMGSGIAITRAIAKYGKVNFIREDIFEGDLELIDFMEAEIIDHFDAVNSNEFYNLKNGGHSGRHSTESKRKISIAGLGRISSDESKLKRSLRMEGEGNNFFGKSHSPESIDKIKLARTSQIITPESNIKRSLKMKSLPKFKCTNCGGMYFKRHISQYHNEKCKKIKL